MLKVLIAEDDLMIADMAEEFLIDCGYDVCGIARTVDEAVALGLRHEPDLILIDLRLANGDLGTQILPRLRSLGRVGVLYATGNMLHLLQSAAEGDACISKPYSFADLRRGLEIVTEIVATGKASPPLPRGLRVLGSATERREARDG